MLSDFSVSLPSFFCMHLPFENESSFTFIADYAGYFEIIQIPKKKIFSTSNSLHNLTEVQNNR